MTVKRELNINMWLIYLSRINCPEYLIIKLETEKEIMTSLQLLTLSLKSSSQFTDITENDYNTDTEIAEKILITKVEIHYMKTPVG